MVYPALLPLMRTPRLLVADWTDAPADLNGLVRFAERRNLVSVRVPSHLNWPLRLREISDLAAVYFEAFTLLGCDAVCVVPTFRDSTFFQSSRVDQSWTGWTESSVYNYQHKLRTHPRRRSWWHPKTGWRTNFVPCLGAKARFLSFNRTHSRAVTDLLTRPNTLRKHLHLVGLSVHCVDVEQRKKPRPTLYMNVKLWLQTDMCIWAPSSWSRRTSGV